MSRFTWTAKAVVAASDEWIWIPDGSREVRTDDYLVVVADEFLPSPTSVFVTEADAAPEHLVDEVTGVARGFGRSRTWWHLSDATRPLGLEPELLRRGAALEARMDVLGLPIAAGVPDFAVPQDVEARRAVDEQTVRDSLTVSDEAFGDAASSERVAWSLREVQRGLVDDTVGRVVSYVDGQPAGTGGWTLAGPVCRLWGGATRRALRGRGAYRAALAGRLEIARSAGATLGLTHGVVDTSSPILTRLGFVRYGETRVLVLDAP
jgi:hypothetical protein